LAHDVPKYHQMNAVLGVRQKQLDVNQVSMISVAASLELYSLNP